MTQITDIIKIDISRETQAVSQTNFNIPLFLATFTNFAERAREYSSLADVAGDFATTSTVYKASQKLFGQQLTPAKIVIGRRQVPGVTVNVGTLANSTLYSITINNTVFSVTSDASATAIEIVAALKIAYNATSISGITFTDNLDGTFTVVSSVNWSFKTSANLTVANQPELQRKFQ